MTRPDPPPARLNPRSRTESRLIAWFAWPLSTVMLGGPPFLLASTLRDNEDGTPEDFWEPVRELGRWAQPAFSSGFDALAVFGTLIVAVAAITGFSGDWTGLTARARVLFSTLTALAAALLLGVAGLTPAVIAASPQSSAQTILLWVAAWGVMLVTLAITEVLSLRSQVVLARARAVRAVKRAQDVGYDWPQLGATAPRRPTTAFVVLFGLPLAGWLAFVLVVVAGERVPLSVGPLLIFLGYGGFITLFGWAAGCDGSASRLPRTLWLGASGVGVVITLSFAVAISSVSETISIGLVIMAIASLIFLLPRSVTRQLPLLGRIQLWRTSLSIRVLRERSAAMQKQWQRHTAPQDHRSSMWSRLVRAVAG